MNETSYNILLPVLKDFSFFIGVALFLVSLVVGLLLLVKPSIINRLNVLGGKRFGFQRAARILEVSSNIDPLFYRYHRIIGIIVTLTSGYVLYYFLLVYDAVAIAQYLAGSVYSNVQDILISAFRLFMLVCSAVILLLGITIFIRPSRLKAVEAWLNRWISLPEPLTVERNRFNQLACKYPRLMGLIIVVLSVYATIQLFLVYTR